MTENDGSEEVSPSSSSSEAPTPTPRSIAQGVFDSATSFFRGDQDNRPIEETENPDLNQELFASLRVDTSQSPPRRSANSNGDNDTMTDGDGSNARDTMQGISDCVT